MEYENIFGEQVSAPYILAAQILYNYHTDTEPSNGEVDFAATKMLGLTVDEIAALQGHLSDYSVEPSGDGNMAFRADDTLILYSLSGHTNGKVRAIEILSSDIKISDGFGSIDDVRIGMTEAEFLNTVKERDCYIIQGAKDDVTNVKIPDTIWFKPVREIEKEAFAKSNIESVSFGYNIKEIGEMAFAECKNLKTVEFDAYQSYYANEVSIGTSAFYGCTSLSELKLPRVGSIIGDGAFSKCTSLKAVDLWRVSEIGIGSFAESGLTASPKNFV